MAISEQLEAIRQHRVAAETAISSNQSQLQNLSLRLNDLTNRRNSLQATLANLEQEKNAIVSIAK